MSINGIKYQSDQGGKSSEIFIKMLRAKGRLRHVGLFYGERSDIESLKQALVYGLGGEGAPGGSISGCMLNFVDKDGHSWVFDRRSQALKVFKDKQVYPLTGLDPDGSPPLMMSSWPPIDTSFAAKEIGYFQMIFEGGKCFANEGYPQSGKNLEKMLFFDECINQNLAGIGTQMPGLAPLSLSQTKQLLMRLEPVYFSWLEITKETEILKKLLSGNESLEAGSIEQLEGQLELISQIEAVGGPLLEKSTNLDALVSELGVIDNKLDALCVQNNVASPAMLTQKIDWEKSLKIITRMSLYEQLVKASEQANELCKNSIEPILIAYYEAMESFLNNDFQITAELQECLRILATELQANTKHRHTPESLVAKTLENFRRILGQVKKSKDTSKETVVPQKSQEIMVADADPASQSLEKSRMAVDYSLGRIGELHASLNANRQSYEVALAPIQDRHEKIVQEYGRIKYLWKEIAKDYGFPTKCTVRQLLGMIQNQGEILQLFNRQKELKSAIAQYRQKVEVLSGLVTEWRKLSRSVKDSPLDQIQILLAETRAIIDYAGKKRHQLAKFKKLQLDVLAGRRLDQLLNARHNSEIRNWKEGFSILALPVIDIKHRGWSNIFNNYRVLCSIMTKRQSLLNTHEFENFLNEEAFGQSLKFFEIDPLTSQKPNLEIISDVILSPLKEHETAGDIIFLVSDPSLAKLFEKAGIPMSQAVSKPIARSGAIAQPLLTSKAQLALQTLTGSKPARL